MATLVPNKLGKISLPDNEFTNICVSKGISLTRSENSEEWSVIRQENSSRNIATYSNGEQIDLQKTKKNHPLWNMARLTSTAGLVGVFSICPEEAFNIAKQLRKQYQSNNYSRSYQITLSGMRFKHLPSDDTSLITWARKSLTDLEELPKTWKHWDMRLFLICPGDARPGVILAMKRSKMEVMAS